MLEREQKDCRLPARVGLMQRPERIILLGAGTLLQGGLWYKFSIIQRYGNDSALYTRYPHAHLTHHRHPPADFLLSRT